MKLFENLWENISFLCDNFRRNSPLGSVGHDILSEAVANSPTRSLHRGISTQRCRQNLVRTASILSLRAQRLSDIFIFVLILLSHQWKIALTRQTNIVVLVMCNIHRIEIVHFRIVSSLFPKASLGAQTFEYESKISFKCKLSSYEWLCLSSRFDGGVKRLWNGPLCFNLRCNDSSYKALTLYFRLNKELWISDCARITAGSRPSFNKRPPCFLSKSLELSW